MKLKNRYLSPLALSLAFALSLASLGEIYAVDKISEEDFILEDKDDLSKKEDRALLPSDDSTKKEDKTDIKPERRGAERKAKIESFSSDGLTFKVVKEEKGLIRIKGTITEDLKPIRIDISLIAGTISTNNSTVTVAILQGMPEVDISTLRLEITGHTDPTLGAQPNQPKLSPHLQGGLTWTFSGNDIESALVQMSSLRADYFADESESFKLTLINVPVAIMGKVKETVTSRGFETRVRVQGTYYAILPMLSKFRDEMKLEGGKENYKENSKDMKDSFENPDGDYLKKPYFMAIDKDRMILTTARGLKEVLNTGLFERTKPKITLILNAGDGFAGTLKKKYYLQDPIVVDQNKIVIPDISIEEVEKMMKDPHVVSNTIFYLSYVNLENYRNSRDVFLRWELEVLKDMENKDPEIQR